MSVVFFVVALALCAAAGYGSYKLFGRAVEARIQAEVAKLQAKVDAKVADVNDKIAGK